MRPNRRFTVGIFILAVLLSAVPANAMCIHMESDIGFEIDFECGFGCGEREHVLSGEKWCVTEDNGGKVEINAYPSKKEYGPHFYGRVGNIRVPHKGKVVITGKNGYYKACAYYKSGSKNYCVDLDYR